MPALKRSLMASRMRAALAILCCGGANPVLRGQHLEIGIGDAGQRRQRHHVAIEAVGDGGLLRGLRRVAVLSPEIELIAGAERGRIVDDLSPAIGQAAGARAGGAGIGFRTGTGEARQQRRARHARLRVGLDESRDRRGDVQIDGLGFLHQRGQLRRRENRATSRASAAHRPLWSAGRPCSRRECRAPDRADPWSGCSPRSWRRCKMRRNRAREASPAGSEAQ